MPGTTSTSPISVCRSEASRIRNQWEYPYEAFPKNVIRHKFPAGEYTTLEELLTGLIPMRDDNPLKSIVLGHPTFASDAVQDYIGAYLNYKSAVDEEARSSALEGVRKAKLNVDTSIEVAHFLPDDQRAYLGQFFKQTTLRCYLRHEAA
ncbi:hypothetical protein D9611_009272 [Ephemerocybe angulata]|uniref:Uncharacterized protein n=1 Tax=Ephemerocybe angulata TaxID=980116 RepID=A0A8H5F474_9AGAR|nr:hypothetical protein D9611_009272 [Tulosesus angulatus]